MIDTHRILRIIILSAAATLTACASTTGMHGDAERGRATVEKWCALCHAVAGAQKPTAPAFEEIARRPGHDEAFFRDFLAKDHFPMTTFRLRDDEREDVVRYLVSLREKG